MWKHELSVCLVMQPYIEYIHSCSSIVFIVGPYDLWSVTTHELLVIIGCMPMQAWYICIRQHGSAVYIGMVVYANDTLECLLYIHTLHYSNAATPMYTCTNDWYVPIFIQYTIYRVIQYTIYTINMYTCTYEWLALYYSNSISILHVVWSHTHVCLNA